VIATAARVPANCWPTCSPFGARGFPNVFTFGIVRWGTRDGHELTQWSSRLDLVESSTFLDPAKIPLRPQRVLYRLLCAIPAIRNYDRLYRFRF
jgi:hypothetical protein